MHQRCLVPNSFLEGQGDVLAWSSCLSVYSHLKVFTHIYSQYEGCPSAPNKSLHGLHEPALGGWQDQWEKGRPGW